MTKNCIQMFKLRTELQVHCDCGEVISAHQHQLITNAAVITIFWQSMKEIGTFD